MTTARFSPSFFLSANTCRGSIKGRLSTVMERLYLTTEVEDGLTVAITTDVCNGHRVLENGIQVTVQIRPYEIATVRSQLSMDLHRIKASSSQSASICGVYTHCVSLYLHDVGDHVVWC